MRRTKTQKRLLILLAILLLGLTAGGFLFAALIKDMPDPSKLKERKIIESTKIYDRAGTTLLYEIHGEEKRTVIPFDSIPPEAKNATIVLEDARFYSHGGIDFRGIARAFFADLTSQNLSQGGSTITQQLVKNSLLGRERTFSRKTKEALLAMLLESRYSKNEILNMYLNQIPYGSNAYGIEAAAQTYFGTSTAHISLAESALLASLPRAPSYYSPYGNHLNELLDRKNLALDRMADTGYISKNEAALAKKEKLEFLPQSRSSIRAPHFVMYIRELLSKKYGEQTIEEGGLSVITTLDARLQEEAEKIVNEGAEFNKNAIKSYNAALVAIDPKNGDILAMVGSKDYFKKSEPEGCSPGINCSFDPQVNIALQLRQPGSAFKPFVYATAFKKGLTPDTVLFDVPTEFNPLCSPGGQPESSTVKEEDCYNPGNYDEKFIGPVTLRKSIAQSRNVPSVKTLYLAGVQDSIKTAQDMGITTLNDPDRYGLSLVLGGAEVKLLDMTSAYGVFAANGILHKANPILKITAGEKMIEEKQDQPQQVIDTEVAQTINDVLSDDNARVPVFQPHGSLWLPDRPAAAKTGTTQEYRDAWTIGYTPSLVVGVWAGNNDNTPMQQKGSGVLAAAPIWNKFIRFATKDTLPEFFTKSENKKSSKPILNGLWQGETIIRVDKISKKIATDLTPEENIEEIAFGEPHDPLFWISKFNPAGEPPADPYRDPQYKNWAAAFSIWLKTSDFVVQPLTNMPTSYDDVHTADAKPKITIEKLEDSGENYKFVIAITSRYPIKEVNATVLDSLIASGQNTADGKIVLEIKKALLGNPPSPVIFKAYDSVGNSSEISLPFGQ
ncbi:MAG: PBP1A family penicillin-binding protein [bacterium]|nr:PBP1A family penicillin-binding protein [bacterium]